MRTAGTETVDPLEFLARVHTNIPDKGQVTTRYYGWYANLSGGLRRPAEPVDAAILSRPCPPAPSPPPGSGAAGPSCCGTSSVDPLACPQCGGAMRIVAFITQTAVIDQILTHRRTRPGARSPPAGAPPTRHVASRRHTRALTP